MIMLGTKVPGFGRVAAVKRGELEREYLCIGGGVVSWLSESDIKTIIECNKQ